MKKDLFEILVCPYCKGKLTYETRYQELWCHFDKLAFPIREDIPIMLESEARVLTTEEL